MLLFVNKAKASSHNIDAADTTPTGGKSLHRVMAVTG
jgi:hypothetical protein